MINAASWVDIDLDAISNNIKTIKEYIGNTRLLVVVKANAYGHGIYPVAACAVESGADFLGVSSLEEGIFLRQRGITEPVLIFNTVLPEQAEDMLKYDLTATVCSFDAVQALNDAAMKMNKKAVVHVKVDTGFGRFGVLPEHAVEMVRLIITNFENIYIEGMYTHFSSAMNKNITRKQFNVFLSIIEQLESQGYKIPLKHVCNSAATLNYPDMHLDMVRIGNLVYGLCPSKNLKINNPAKIYSKIILLKKLPKGHYVGYGSRFKTKRPTTIAIVPFGYYDGLELLIFQPNGIWDSLKNFFKQLLAGFGIVSATRKVKINGIQCNILGKISMQNCVVDVTDIKDNVFVGDIVEVNARRINLSHSLSRIYRRAGQVFSETDTAFTVSKVDTSSNAKQRRETSIG
ncbi:MAG: alanine racemase [Tepidanaerobacteraceae bacterium]|jgi:alanine racemase